MAEEKVTVQAVVMTTPELEDVESKASMVSFLIQTNVQKYDLRIGGYTQNQSSVYKVIAFNRLGRNVYKSVKKGDRIVVAGNLYIRPDPRDKKALLQAEIHADVVGHDLNWYLIKTKSV